jgi:hypothetical protein
MALSRVTLHGYFGREIAVEKQIQIPMRRVDETVRVSITVKDDRGFTHYYEEVVTTPAAVRDAYNLMVHRAPTVGIRPTAS